ncbi:enoyl-CoA hydratase-related protein [Carboxydothermus hydrogenoformans]|uniref:short-chain-enoyl-CoA hydratase n=1 Tax=Carboxydothermus hydrogenoformans (strain ATCC BAA-161 / DSM 6008 / Z-2901) TaxID=246194 RepID=Q3ABC5_CARHZ|nr:enoyl-CoA hydratase-related protein [Carboxydothermus hydrogenoformans]ABB15187.1 putative 3-hydroxybutyryl-CoA dehydratase [Carboxydothermus hydrogenoformans Z-2901]
MEFEKIKFEVTDGYAVIYLNNPPVNALGQKVLKDLQKALQEIEKNPEIRAVIISGEGSKVFCAGADITEFADRAKGILPEVEGSVLFRQIELFPKPVIAALNGSSYGGGTELAISCHLRILADDASMALPEVKLGIIPGWGGTQRLPRLIGKTRALEAMLTGEPITAEEALSYGLVNKVVPKDQVLTEARALAAKLAKGAPIAMREILKAVTLGLDTSIEEGLKIEKEGSKVAFSSEDAVEGRTAFFEKRPPNFKGR